MSEKARGKQLLESAESAGSSAALLVQMFKIFARNRACVSVSGEVAMGPVPARKVFPPINVAQRFGARDFHRITRPALSIVIRAQRQEQPVRFRPCS